MTDREKAAQKGKEARERMAMFNNQMRGKKEPMSQTTGF
jgi:hypothetical protein